MATLADPKLGFGQPESFELRKLRGAVYTPPDLAAWVAELLLDECSSRKPHIVDFGCGEGALLEACSAAVPMSRLAGVEMNELAAARARRALTTPTEIIADNVLSPRSAPRSNLASYWRSALGSAPEAIIMNPPWGASHSLAGEKIARSGLTLAKGQFDTYDLFCELALQVVRSGGAYGFILPDSLFLPEHRQLRELLTRTTTIKIIARLGEGIFPGIYRGCVVVAGRAAPPPSEHRIECMRLTKRDRETLKGGASFCSLRRSLVHQVPQSRFAADPEKRFDIDVTEQDQAVMKILAAGGGWTQPLESRRGTEISKSGNVLVCQRCGSARPQPKTDDAKCFACNAALSNARSARIIADRPGQKGEWIRFIAGEDVRRYSSQSTRWIRTDMHGINYKKRSKRGVDRLLVRKTGIGLNATIDSSDSMTNQVVFEYTIGTAHNFPFSYLHYILGVLCSRLMFAFHLKRSGELEWRSHPYVTQKTLATLPIPVPERGTQQCRQAASIAAAVSAHLDAGEGDLEIERLVAGLYGLDRSDMDWALSVLDKAADLEPMRRLRVPATTRIDPLTVA